MWTTVSEGKKAAAGAEKNGYSKVRGFLREVLSEMKKVHWPDRRELISYTWIVLSTVLIIAVILWLFDSGFSFLLGTILGK